MLHHLFVNTSLGISTKTAVVKRQLQQHYQTREISNHVSPPNAQAVWRLSWYCIFNVCLNKDYDLPASLDHRIVSDDYMVMSCTFAMGSPLPRVCPSVFGWWLPLPHPPLSAETSWHSTWASAQARQWFMPHDSCIAIVWQPDSQVSGRTPLDSAVTSQVCHLSIVETEGFC